MAEIVAAIEAAAPAMRGKITFEPTQLPNPTEVDDSALNAALGSPDWRPLIEGVQQTIDLFQKAAANGKVDVERILA